MVPLPYTHTHSLSLAFSLYLPLPLYLHSSPNVSSSLPNVSSSLRRYETILANMRRYSTHLSGSEIAHVMKRITELITELHDLETDARAAFSVLGRKVVDFMKPRTPLRFAKHNSDPLYDVQFFPLCAHVLIVGATVGLLGVLLRRRGFERHRVGGIRYWARMSRADESRADEVEQRRRSRADSSEDAGGVGTGTNGTSPPTSPQRERFDSDGDTMEEPSPSPPSSPIVFVHGIGVGLLPYLAFVDKLVETGRTVFLPEVAEVTGFRCWEGPATVKSPATVASFLAAMIGSHGFLQASFVG